MKKGAVLSLFLLGLVFASLLIINLNLVNAYFNTGISCSNGCTSDPNNLYPYYCCYNTWSVSCSSVTGQNYGSIETLYTQDTNGGNIAPLYNLYCDSSCTYASRCPGDDCSLCRQCPFSNRSMCDGLISFWPFYISSGSNNTFVKDV